MSPMLVKDKVFILKATRYGDSDLILNCLNSKGARVSLFARSALKSKKRFGGGVLEPTHYVNVMYEEKNSPSSSESRLGTLKEASLVESFPGLRTDYARIETALHVVNLVGTVIREGEVDAGDIFNLLGNTLRAIESSDISAGSVKLDHLRTHFEVKLLANQGVLPVEDIEEQQLLSVPISENEKIELADEEWRRLRIRIRQILSDYL